MTDKLTDSENNYINFSLVLDGHPPLTPKTNFIIPCTPNKGFLKIQNTDNARVIFTLKNLSTMSERNTYNIDPNAEYVIEPSQTVAIPMTVTGKNEGVVDTLEFRFRMENSDYPKLYKRGFGMDLTPMCNTNDLQTSACIVNYPNPFDRDVRIGGPLSHRRLSVNPFEELRTYLPSPPTYYGIKFTVSHPKKTEREKIEQEIEKLKLKLLELETPKAS